MAETPDELVVSVRAEFDPAVEDVKRLTLRPGDTLAVVMSEAFNLTQENVTLIRRVVRHQIGEQWPVLVLPAATKLVVLGEEELRGAPMTDEDCDHEGELVYLQEQRQVRCERCGEMWQAVEKHLRRPGVPFADEQRAGAELK